jgi:hypothetical protein
MTAKSCEETLGGSTKKKPAMAHSQPGNSSMNIDEALGGVKKKKPPMAHSMPGTTSHEDEALGGMAKKKPAMVAPGGGLGDASDAV